MSKTKKISNNEHELSSALENTLREMFKQIPTKPVKENNSGTPIKPSGAIPSKDRAKLLYLFNSLQNMIYTKQYDIDFQGDRIVIKLKDESSDSSYDFTPYMGSVLEYMLEQDYKITPLPEVKIKKDLEESANFFGKTAEYDPEKKEISLYVIGRHPKDIVRSFAHEMIHHMQNLEGRLGQITTSDTNSHKHLQKLEEEAYLKGNMVFRGWEDMQKNGKPKE